MKNVGKLNVSERFNGESQVEVKKNKWRNSLEGKKIGKVKQAELQSNVGDQEKQLARRGRERGQAET